MDERSILSKLYLISNLTIQEVKEAIRSGELFNISLDHITGYPRFDAERAKQLIFAYSIINKIKARGEYNTLVFEITKYRKRLGKIEHFTEKLLPEFFLRNIINKILEYSRENREVPNEDLSNEIENYIDDFIRELKGEPLYFKLTTQIKGVELEPTEEAYHINDKLIIRKPTASELEEKSHSYSGRKDIAFEYLIQARPPDAVLEQTFFSPYFETNMDVIEGRVDSAIASLQLLKVCSVFKQETKITINLSLRREVIHDYSALSIPVLEYPCSIKMQEISKLQKIVEIAANLLPEKFSHQTHPVRQSDIIPSDISPITIALQRFNEALFKTKQQGIESRITYAIMCLEALFLGESEKQELSHKLSQRVATLMRLVGLKKILAINVFDDIKKAYTIRSDYLHGSTKPHDIDEIRQLEQRVLNYARRSLLVFLQMKYSDVAIENGKDQKKGKKKKENRDEKMKKIFISKIDRSTLHQPIYRELKGKISHFIT